MIGKIAGSIAALASVAAAVDPLSVKGSNFVTSSSQRFDIVGIAYQPGGSAGFNPSANIDPLSDPKACLRDAALMNKMGVNAIRVYNLDPTVSHDECAGIFDAAGIYMLIDVNSPLVGQSLDASAPWTTYTKDYLTRVFQVIEAFKGYPNLIGFFSGNEVINNLDSGKIDPPYIRAVTRDMKNYIAKNSPGRAIPVGYSAADVRQILVDTSNYLQCDNGDNSNIEFFGLNSYSWCGDSNPQKAGYDVLTQDFNETAVPVFFSEYGCNAVTPRPFTEVAAIYGSDMNAVFSGGLVYEWTQEANNYGLINVASDGSAKLMTDYDTLQKQLAANKPSSTSLSSTGGTAQKCSSGIISGDGFSNNFTLPAVPDGVQDLIDNGVKTGFTGGAAVATPTATACPYPVQDTNGQTISGLAIPALNGQTSIDGKGVAVYDNATSSSPSSSSSSSSSTTGDFQADGAAPSASSAGSKAESTNTTSSSSAKSTNAAGLTSASLPLAVAAAIAGVLVL